jgi:replicative DNA helicase
MENKRDDYRIVSSEAMLEEIESQGRPEFRMVSNLSSLDEVVDGFVEGELITISGPTKNGKTLFAQSLTNQFCKQGALPLWFSYEVTPKYFLRAFPILPHFFMPRRMKMSNLDWVLEKMLEGLKKHATRIVFIDHLHYLVDIARMNNVSIEVGTVIRRLKTFAVEHELIVFLMCHTRKGASEEILSHESIRDSSFVAQESDTVFLISRDMKNPEKGRARLLVEFHRRTGALHTIINLIKRDGYLVEEDYRQPTLTGVRGAQD